MEQFQTSNEGLEMTKQFEGLRLTAYQDVAGVWTIGYGHTGPDVQPGRVISELEAEALLRADLAAAVKCVNASLEVEVTQSQFDALVDFCFNVGRRHFLASSLLQYLNHHNFDAAAVQFGLWVNADGRPQPGLVKRRAAEAAMFRKKLAA